MIHMIHRDKIIDFLKSFSVSIQYMFWVCDKVQSSKKYKPWLVHGGMKEKNKNNMFMCITKNMQYILEIYLLTISRRDHTTDLTLNLSLFIYSKVSELIWQV